MFRAVLSHPQEALYKQHLVYCVHVLSVGCTRIEVQSADIPSAVCGASPENEQVMVKIFRGPE
jgi:hypothetical protein